MRYSIEGQELTNIADVLRSKYGENQMITVNAPTEIYNETAGISASFGDKCKTITVNGAKTIYVNAKYATAGGTYFEIGSGEFTVDTVPEDAVLLSGGNNTPQIEYLRFDNTDTITIRFNNPPNGWGYGCYAQVVGTDDNGTFVGDGATKDVEIEMRRVYETKDFVGAIALLDKLPEEAFAISGDCTYRFAQGGWDWFIREYGNKITTENVSGAQNMFFNSYVTEIPFELNFDKSRSYHNMYGCFNGATNLISAPKINNCKPERIDYLFYGCKNLREVPEDIGDWFDWSYMDNNTSAYSCNKSSMFYNCYSLRVVPLGLFEHANKVATYSYAHFSSAFSSCYALDEIVNLPIPYTGTWTSNAFGSMNGSCYRLKNLTFAMPNGQPYVMNWKSQTIDVSSVGYTPYILYVTDYNSGIGEDKEVKDDVTYQALKDDPDWFATKLAYSRYNHDSAVATINSLPDTSAYLATAGGTNTIKFKKGSGSATDGGAVDTLTEEEIAVATAKGWTVSFV